MTCFLLTWNPERWTWSSLDDDLRKAAEGEPVDGRWSTGNTKRIVAGDRVFLLKQGRKPRGIMASGCALGPVREEEHWADERRLAGDKALFVSVRFDRLVAPDSVLGVEALTTGPLSGMNWRPAASGFEVPDELVPELERAWNEFVPQRSPVAAAEELTPGLRYVEGAVQTVLVNKYERSVEARKRCIDAHGTQCVVCGFAFVELYGPLGEGFIHVHHLLPLHASGGAREFDPVRDLRPVCPNCHAMLHRRDPPLSIDELQRMLRRRSR